MVQTYDDENENGKHDTHQNLGSLHIGLKLGRGADFAIDPAHHAKEDQDEG
jgi:hypothetical protein